MQSMAAFGVVAGDGRGEHTVQPLYTLRAPRTEGETRAASSMARADAGTELWSSAQLYSPLLLQALVLAGGPCAYVGACGSIGWIAG